MSDAATTNLTDKATYERLQKDVIAVKNDIAALTEQITDALNSFAGSASRQARRGYRQARANAEHAVDDVFGRYESVLLEPEHDVRFARERADVNLLGAPHHLRRHA